jgi:magnesium chelatase subunit D
MTSGEAAPVAPPGAQRWHDAVKALWAFALDPVLLGGVWLRAPHGPVRDRWLAEMAAVGGPGVRIPTHVDDERLMGGLDLSASLRSGSTVAQSGLLSRAHGHWVVLPMAERMRADTLARLVQAQDRGEVHALHVGNQAAQSCAFGVVALDESLDDEPPLASALCDRLSLWLDLSELAWADVGHSAVGASPWANDHDHDNTTASASAYATTSVASMRQAHIATPHSTRPLGLSDAPPIPLALLSARERLTHIHLSDDQTQALCHTALALGVGSLRASLAACRLACASAAWHGHTEVSDEDVAWAARMVLAPRATQLPASPPEDAAEPEPPPPSEAEAPPPDDVPPPEPPPEDHSDDAPEDTPAPPSAQEMQELVLAAALASIPPNLLDRMVLGANAPKGARSAGGSGAAQRSRQRGRPLAPRPGSPGHGARLHVLATLRAAAPRQKLRPPPPGGGRIAVRSEDFHIHRFQQKQSSCMIFAVDASGSAALARLAEAKGAVELMLQQSYARRDQVCVIAFRGTKAEVLLPPTRSLVRAKRALGGLPGGGGTPLATALKLCQEQAQSQMRLGVTPLLVVLCDGRANVNLQGLGGRESAMTDALAWAQAWRSLACASVWLDTSTQPDAKAQQLAQAMGARYLPMPHAQAQRMAAVMQSLVAPATA